MDNPVLAVIDTNVIVSGLYTKNPLSPTVQILNFIGRRLIRPVIHETIIEEYREVLHRPKFHFDPVVIDRFIIDFINLGLHANPKSFEGEMVDPKDRIFYEISLSGDNYLVTGNIKHFPKSPKVVSPSYIVDLILSNI